VHVRDSGVGGGGRVVEEVADSTISVDCALFFLSARNDKKPGTGVDHTLTVYRHVDHFDITVLAKNLRDVCFGDILGELFNHDL
jgi:hypothetical protein